MMSQHVSVYGYFCSYFLQLIQFCKKLLGGWGVCVCVWGGGKRCLQELNHCWLVASLGKPQHDSCLDELASTLCVMVSICGQKWDQVSGQIYFAIWTNTFVKFRQMYLAIRVWMNQLPVFVSWFLFVRRRGTKLLDKSIWQFGQVLCLILYIL